MSPNNSGQKIDSTLSLGIEHQYYNLEYQHSTCGTVLPLPLPLIPANLRTPWLYGALGVRPYPSLRLVLQVAAIAFTTSVFCAH